MDASFFIYSNSLGYNTNLIPKLDGSRNYKTWKLLCTSMLEAFRVLNFVQRSVIPCVPQAKEWEYLFQDTILGYIINCLGQNIIPSACKQYIRYCNILSSLRASPVGRSHCNQKFTKIQAWHFVSPFLTFKPELVAKGIYLKLLDEGPPSGIAWQPTVRFGVHAHWVDCTAILFSFHMSRLKYIFDTF